MNATQKANLFNRRQAQMAISYRWAFMRTCNHHRTSGIGIILTLLLPMFSLGGLAATNEIDYRRFLSNQPPIHELVFSVQRANLQPAFYFLQCQGSNFVVREASAPDRLRGPVSQMDDRDRCYGYCDGEVWRVARFQGRAIYTHGTKALVPKDKMQFVVEPLYESSAPNRCALDFRTRTAKQSPGKATPSFSQAFPKLSDMRVRSIGTTRGKSCRRIMGLCLTSWSGIGSSNTITIRTPRFRKDFLRLIIGHGQWDGTLNGGSVQPGSTP